MANAFLPAAPVSSFLQGRQFSQQQQEAQQINQLRGLQIQQAQDAQSRDEQFRNELSTYLQGGSDGLATLYALDPERAMRAQQFQVQQNELARGQAVQQAKQTYAQAQGVLDSEAPATYLRILIPKIAQQWAEHNGKSAEEMTDEEAKQLARQVSVMAGAQAGIDPSAGGFDLAEGAKHFDKRGNIVASNPKQPTVDDALKRQQQLFERANTLRDEYDTQSKEFTTATQAYQRVLSSAKDPSAAGDLALIFAYMRTLDPNSSVREGEFANAESAGSVPSRIWAKYNKVLSGERLSDDQRQDFVQRAGQLWQGQKDIDRKRRTKYSKLAERAGVNSQDVIGDEINVDVPTSALAVGQSTTQGGFTVKRVK